jgi:pyridoxine 5'-phosphate synthase PdxJ
LPRYARQEELFILTPFRRLLSLKKPDIACNTLPEEVCLVPEKREELTTEGGLDVAGNISKISDATRRLQEAGILVSLFIDPDRTQLDASIDAGATVVELHTGHFADAKTDELCDRELESIWEAVDYGRSKGLKVNNTRFIRSEYRTRHYCSCGIYWPG